MIFGLALAKLLTVKGMAVAASTVALSTGTAAAVTGNLPAVGVLGGGSSGAVTATVPEVVEPVEAPADLEEATAAPAEAPTTEGDDDALEELEEAVVEGPPVVEDAAGSANDHGEGVSAAAQDDTLVGREKGEAVSEAARGANPAPPAPPAAPPAPPAAPADSLPQPHAAPASPRGESPRPASPGAGRP